MLDPFVQISEIRSGYNGFFLHRIVYMSNMLLKMMSDAGFGVFYPAPCGHIPSLDKAKCYDTLLQISVLILGFVGWYWTKKNRFFNVDDHFQDQTDGFILVCSNQFKWSPCFWVRIWNHGAAYPFLDAGLFAFQLTGSDALLVQEKTWNWIAWMIIINSISIPIFSLEEDIYFFCLSFILFWPSKVGLGNWILSTNANKR